MGDKFDPALHHAVFNIPEASDASKNGTVGHVVVTGYTLHDRVVRPAQVGVFVSEPPK